MDIWKWAKVTPLVGTTVCGATTLSKYFIFSNEINE